MSLAGAALGALALGAPALPPTCCRSRRLSTGRRSTGPASISAGIPATAAAASSAVLTDPAHRRIQRQFQRRDRRRAGRLQFPAAVRPAARRRGRPHLSELPDLEFDRLAAHDRALRRHRAAGLCRHRARPHRLRQRHWLAYATGGLAFAGERFLNTPAVGDEEKHINVRLGWAAGAGLEYAFAPHWSVRLEYLYSQFERANVSFPSGTQYTSTLDFQSLRIGLNRKVDWPGIAKLDAEDRPDRSRIQPLGNPRPDHLSAAGLSGFPRALYRHQQPDAGAAGAGDLEQQPVPERAAVGRRRGLLQSRTAAGIWPERHRRRRRLSQRRSAEIELPLPALQHLAAVPAPDLRLRRRAGGAGERPTPARRQGRRLPADAAGRQVRRASTCSTATPTPRTPARIS